MCLLGPVPSIPKPRAVGRLLLSQALQGGVSAPTALPGSGRARRLTVPNAETLLSP